MTTTNPVWLFNRFIFYFVDVIEVILGLRFIFRLLGANSGNVFIAFLYNLSEIFLSPFRGIFPTTSVEGAVVEWSTLVAMAIYALLAYLLVRLLIVMTTTPKATYVDSGIEE